MRKNNFTQIREISLLIVCLFFSAFSINAQTTCNSLVHISLDNNCQAAVGPDQILEGTYNFADYAVTFASGPNAGQPVILGPNNIGQTISVMVSNIADPSVTPCWGNILVEDKLAPSITCNDLVLTCTDPIPTTPASATDACSSVTVTFEDVVVDNGCSGMFAQVITRTHTATDASGNTATCVQTISIERGTLATIVYPSNVTIDCQDSTSPSNTGEPIGATCSNINVTFDDVIIQICEGSYKIVRTWTALDWCTNVVGTETQIINVSDSTGPSLSSLDNIAVSTNSNGCTANVSLPAISATDDCSGSSFTYLIQTPLGDLNTNGGLLLNAPIGTHTITYHVTDACGNSSYTSLTVTVTDGIAPIAICDEHTVVSIGSDGTASVPALTFDDGSYDNCGDVTYEVRRMDNPSCPGFDGTAFGAYVPFTCCDLGATIMVELRVTDAAGNTNSCMVEAEVQDKLAPTIVCPANKTIDCTEDFTDLALTGEAVGFDNCSGVVVTSNDISVNIGCGGAGTVTRVWTATDAQGLTASCIQTITIENNDPFNGNDIQFPLDYTANTCGLGLAPSDLSAPFDRPVINDDACDFVAVTYDDTQLGFGAGDACLKILRKWTVIDWCQAANNPDPTQPGPGVWQHVQIIIVNNSTDPNITPVSLPTVFDNFDASCGSVFAAFAITADDDCTAQSDLDVTYEFSTGLTGSGFSASGGFANGAYSVTFTVNDQCGNSSTLTHNFTVVDAKKPTPVCLFGLSTVVMPSAGSVSLWASDFESGSSFDNCTPAHALQFSFSSNVNNTNLIISCADVAADGLFPIELWVTDAAGNQDFCSTFVQIQDPNGVCGGPAAAVISGLIENEYQEEVEDVTVEISGGNMVPVVTGANGTYTFNQTSMGGNYTITPEKDMNYLNGVTTYDLVLISKHILGTELLDSPYKVIAADANASASVTTLDIVKLRALILHIDTELSNNDSWRFVDASHVFTDATNPFATAFPEASNFNNLSASAQANFIGVKIGDVNGSSAPNSLIGSETRTFAGTLTFDLEDKKVAAGEEFTVDFKANDFNAAGYQFAIEFNNVEFVDVATKLDNLTADNFGFTLLNEGVITTSWNAAEAVKVANDEVIFSLTFKANSNVQLSEVLSLDARYTNAEAYVNNDLYNVAFDFGTITNTTNDFTLYQNTPNPFKAETTIGFNLPEASTVNLKVYDVAGRVLKSINGDFAKGYHEVNINRSELNATGVLYYQLDTDNNTATKKMILVD